LSAEILRRLDEERAFWPRGRFHELALDYVPWDDLTGAETVDGRIDRALRNETGCVPVIGPSGSGKSAAIAAAAQRLSDRFTCLRIPVAAVGDVAGSPVALGQHILREAVQQAELALVAHQKRSLIEAAADKLTRREPQQGVGGKLQVGIPGLSAEIGGDLKASGLDREELVNATGVVQGLDRLVSIFTARGREPVLIFEDTDAWLSRTQSGQSADAADRFFADSLAVLVRDVDIRIVIATHTAYIELEGYRSIRERLLTEVEIPSLDRPRDAIARILQKRIDVTTISASVGDVFADEGLARLVAEYDHSHRSIRHVLNVCDTALEQAAPTYPDRLTEDHLRGASVALRGPV
jgi:Cdc6-like AAA superfamily ATPase